MLQYRLRYVLVVIMKFCINISHLYFKRDTTKKNMIFESSD